jgi:N-acetylneuraminic acid mutarotase
MKIVTKKISITLSLIVLSSSLFAGWVQKADLPATGRKWPATFSINSKAYIACGSYFGTQFTQDLWSWDQSTDTWTQEANFPGLGRDGAVGTEVNGKGYVVMGWDGLGSSQSNLHTDMYEYDPVANSWTQKTDMPGIGRYCGMGVSINNKFYVGMGLAPGWNYQNDWYEYDPVNDTWMTKASFHVPLDLAACFQTLGKGYIVCGNNSSGVNNEVWQYDPVADSWTQKSNFLGAARCNTIGWSWNYNGLVGMGTDASGTALYSDFWVYDPLFDSWSSSVNFPGGVRRSGFGFSIGECAYMGNGQDANFNEISDLWEYCAPTSVNDISKENSITISPAVLVKDAPINVYGNLSAEANYILYNIFGKKISDGLIFKNSIRFKDVNLESGMYLIEIVDPIMKNHFSGKLIVQN